MVYTLALLALALAAPPQAAPLILPKLVAPPTLEQVNAVPPDVVRFLQTGAFDPSLVPAAVKPATTVVAVTNPLEGTVWVRETKGGRVVLKFTRDRIDAELTAPDGVSLAVAADYALGRDGLIFGVVTAAESPDADVGGLGAKLLAADGAPYCFRVRIDGDTLTVRNFRCGAAGANYAALGAYRLATAQDLSNRPSKP